MPVKGSERSSRRDSAPHLSNPAARSRRESREPALHIEKVRSTSEEQLDDEGTLESEDPFSDYARESLKDSKPRRLKIAHKERGSLRRAFRDDGLPSRNRNRDTPGKTHAQHPNSKSKLKALNKTKVDVFIPSIVSVGNLARILGVSLSEPHFVGQHTGFSLP